MYVSRFMSLSLVINRPMLAFPAVTVTDIMIARAFLEAIGAYATLFLVMIIIYVYGDDPFPWDPKEAIFAFISALFLALGVGFLAGVLVMFMPFFANIYALMMVISITFHQVFCS